MIEHSRPNPDELLARVHAEEQQQSRGKLKIFLGYAAGVGKTYAMLEAGHARKIDHVDVVVGYVETHHRAETEALVQGLETVPRKEIEYRGRVLTEMDVDAVLARKPQLALVDEFAHTNAPGSRHPKRYLDVQEILAAGIDVYTTLNIQHLESLNDVVAQITGVVVHETIPDNVIDQSAEIELIDLAPDELLQRLKDGKVYVPEQAVRAIEKFFRKGNLTALREIALRRTADRVDDQMRDYMETRAIAGPWAAKERLLVCVSPGALSERLIRTARRLADELDAEWIAMYVETPNQARMSQHQRGRMERMLHLAEERGAKTLTVPNVAVAATIVQYARAHNITKIIAGKPVRPRVLEVLRGSVVDQIIRQSGSIDVYVISGEVETSPIVETRDWQPHRPLRRYVLSLGLVAAATLLGFPIHALIDPTNLVMIYLVAVVVAAAFWGRGPSIFAAVFGVLALDFFFVPPAFTFAVSDTQYILTFTGFLIVGLVISALTVRVREQADAALQREAQTAELYEFTRDLSATSGIEEILQAVIKHVSQTFSREIVILLPEGETLKVRASTPDFTLTQNEFAVASWAYQHNESAGRGTDTLPASPIHCRPLKTFRGVMGVLGVKPSNPVSYLTQSQARLLESFANQAALAIERAQLAEESQKAKVQIETERTRNALLSSISHDLKTPLAAITGAAGNIIEESQGETHDLAQTIAEEADRLNRLIRNLLDMTRLEAGAVQVRKEWQALEEIVGAVLARLDDRLSEHPITTDIPADLPLVPLDSILIEQVLMNLLENAIKYTPVGSPIDISAHITDHEVLVQIADRGPGIPPGDEERVFDKFYRVRPDGGGVGLGLTVCRGALQAHGGRIWAQNREGGGAIFEFTLPLEGTPPQVKPE